MKQTKNFRQHCQKIFVFLIFTLLEKVDGSCFLYKYTTYGTDVASIGNIGSAEDCQNLCQLNYNCDFFVYGPSTKSCWLRNAATTVLASTDRITGSKYCNDFDCFDYDIHWTGNTIVTLTAVFSPRDCQAQCYSNVDCINFVYRTIDRYCFLKSSKTGEAADGYIISGPRACTVYRDSCFYNVNIYANNLRYFDGCATAFHCQLECKKDSNCFAFTFAFEIGRCYLKTSSHGIKRVDTNYISGPKICDRMIDKCLFNNINVNALTARTISPITSVQQCQYECQMDKKCLFFTYHVTADICYLKQGFGTVVTSLQPYYISGPKYCGFSTGVCDNYLYTQSDGSLKCGSFIEHGLVLSAASDQCAAKGAIIPDLQYQNDRQMINLIRLSDETGPVIVKTPFRYLWIGLNDRVTEGTYIWNSTGNQTTYTYWLSGQPDNSAADDCTCTDWPEHGLWVDTTCSNGGIASMCEKPITTPLPNNCNTAPYLKSDGSYVCGYILPTILTMDSASTQCSSLGGRLPESKSAADNQYLQLLFYMHKVNGYWWLGVSDQAVEGTWLLSSSGAVATYKNWGTGEGSVGNWENCAVVSANYGLWADVACTKQYWTLCEKAVQASPPDPDSTDTCIMDAAYKRTCFRVLGSGTFDSGNTQCQALGGHLPLVKTSIAATFLANKFGGNIWMSLKTNSFSNICTGQTCVTSKNWFWFGDDGVTTQLAADDLTAVKDMVSTADSKTCMYLKYTSSKELIWTDGFCSTDSFKIICQFEDQGLFSSTHYCFKDNMMNNGNIFKTKFLVPSVLMCQFECQNSKGCQAFNYNKGSQQCDMIDSNGVSESVSALYMTGPQMCGVMTGLFFKYSSIELLPDGYISNEKNSTADDIISCAGMCNAAFLENANCTAFQYSSPDSKCKLFSIGPDAYQTTNGHSDVNLKTLMRDKLFQN